jgi:hypothetical protein
MTPKVNENKEFAEWFRDWIATIQQNRAPVERTLPETAADGQKHSDGTHLLDSKRRVAQGRHVA